MCIPYPSHLRCCPRDTLFGQIFLNKHVQRYIMSWHITVFIGVISWLKYLRPENRARGQSYVFLSIPCQESPTYWTIINCSVSTCNVHDG